MKALGRISAMIAAAMSLAIIATACDKTEVLGESNLVGRTFENDCEKDQAFRSDLYRKSAFSFTGPNELSIVFRFYSDSSCADSIFEQHVDANYNASTPTSENVADGSYAADLDITYLKFANKPLTPEEAAVFNQPGSDWGCGRMNWEPGVKQTCGNPNFTAYTSLKLTAGMLLIGMPTSQETGDTAANRIKTLDENSFQESI